MPRVKSSFVRQAAILAAASLFARFIGFLYRLPLTDLIGDRGNAIYAAGYNIYTFALIMTTSSVPAAVAKMVSERLARKEYGGAREVFKAAMLVSLVLGGVGALLIWVFAPQLARLGGYPESVYAIRTLAPTIFIGSIAASDRGYFQGMGHMLHTALSQVADQIFNAVFSIWLAYLFFDAARIELAAAGGTAGTGVGVVAGLLVILIIYLIASKRLRARADEDTQPREKRSKLIKELLRTALPVTMGMAVFSMVSIIDMAMVAERLAASGAFTYERIQELYGQLTGKYILLTTLPVSLSTAMAVAVIPAMAGSRALGDKREMRRSANRALRLSMMISIPAAVGLGVLAQPILTLLFPAHTEGAVLLRYGAVNVVVLAFIQVLTGLLHGSNRMFAPVIGALCGACVKIPLNYVLLAIPELNVTGAVFSTLACYLVAATLDMLFIKRHIKLRFDITGIFVKPAVAAAGMGMACYAFHQTLASFTAPASVSALVSIALGAPVYFVVLYMLGGLKPEDMARRG
jgi:stage V sporulation protein B